MDFRTTFPSIADLEKASPEAIGAAVVLHIQQAIGRYGWRFNARAFADELGRDHVVWNSGMSRSARPFIAMGVRWAQNNYLLVEALNPVGDNGFMDLTAAGQAFKPAIDLPSLRLKAILPEMLLHPEIKEAALEIFMIGRYRAAVFQGFATLEAAIRRAAEMDVGKHGMPMASEAFNAKHGRLRDEMDPAGEREAMQLLMGGAIGVFKNPRSHRPDGDDDPVLAAEMLVIASHLMRIVDERAVLWSVIKREQNS